MRRNLKNTIELSMRFDNMSIINKNELTTSDSFIKCCKELVMKYENDHIDKTDGISINEDNVYVVWSCFILGNQKALLSTTLPDGMYFEITYDKNNNSIYFDAYKKFENCCIHCEELDKK